MTPKSFTTLALTLFLAALLISCTKKETTNTSSEVTVPPPSESGTVATATKPTDIASMVTAPAWEPIGIAECDDYFTKYVACVTNRVPESSRAQYNASIQQISDQWQQLAANPQTRASLPFVCKSAADASRQSMRDYGCQF